MFCCIERQVRMLNNPFSSVIGRIVESYPDIKKIDLRRIAVFDDCLTR